MKKQESMASLVIVLFVICAITALLLGLVNDVTKDKIAAINEAKTIAAMNEVLAADSYVPVDYTGDDTQITKVNKAGDIGYVVELSVSGSQGMISMVVGVNNDSTVAGVAIVSMKETAGLGDKAADESYRAQYLGTTGNAAVNKDGGEIAALTGATVTSRAVTDGVNAAVAAVATIG